MTTQHPFRPDQLQHLLDQMATDHKAFIAVYRAQWRTEDDRQAAAKHLRSSVDQARVAAERLSGTGVPELRPLINRLIIESTLADDMLRHPNMLTQ